MVGGRAEGPLAPAPAGFAGHLSQFSFLIHLGWRRERPLASEKGVPNTPRFPNSWGGSEAGAVGRGGGGSHRFSSAVTGPCLSFPSPLHVGLGGQRQDEGAGVPAG